MQKKQKKKKKKMVKHEKASLPLLNVQLLTNDAYHCADFAEIYFKNERP